MHHALSRVMLLSQLAKGLAHWVKQDPRLVRYSGQLEESHSTAEKSAPHWIMLGVSPTMS